jgi:hypothetical protein
MKCTSRWFHYTGHKLLFGIANLEQKNIPLATTNIKIIRMGYHSERALIKLY